MTKKITQDETQVEDTQVNQVDLAFEAIKAAFQNEMSKENPDEEAVKMAMLMAGAKFANVARYFNQLMVEFGFAKSKEERNEILDKLLAGIDLTVESAFDDAVIRAGEALDVGERSAGTSVRMWCKRNKTEFFKKPKFESGDERKSLESTMQNWILSNMDSTIEQFKDAFNSFVGENRTKPEKIWPRFESMWKFSQQIKTKYA